MCNIIHLSQPDKPFFHDFIDACMYIHKYAFTLQTRLGHTLFCHNNIPLDSLIDFNRRIWFVFYGNFFYFTNLNIPVS